MQKTRAGVVAVLFTFVDPLASMQAAEDAVLLQVGGDVKTPLALTAGDLAKMPRTTASMVRDGENAEYEGVLLYDILLKAFEVPPGKGLPGDMRISYILVTARDGFQALFALPEILPAFAGARVMIADKRNGGPLLPYQRPLQMISPQDKAQGRSPFSVIKVELVRLQPARQSSAGASLTKP
jgi:hypothetical protein